MKEIVILNSESLLTLLPKKTRRLHIRIESQNLSYNDSLKYERKINKLYNSCGCDFGAISMLLALISVILYLFLQQGSFSNTLWSEILIGLFTIVGGALTGKFLGVIVDRIRLGRFIKNLAKRMA